MENAHMTSWLDANGKRVLVTGGGSGIGRAIVDCFARAGADVAIADINLSTASEVASQVKEFGRGALAIEMDVTNEESVEAGVEKVSKAFEGIDVVVSNAGMQLVRPLDDLTLEEWRRVMTVHVDGAFLLTRACLRCMYAQNRGGSFIYMGSKYSKEGARFKAPYVTAKHALLGLARAVAQEGAERGVRANVICPGFVRTPMVDRQIPELASTMGVTEEEVVKRVMLGDTVDGEFTTIHEVALAVLFLAVFPTMALTGQSLIVSHGWHME